MKLILKNELCGSTLDIGGGGEGIIVRVYKEAVTAIYNMQEELDEAPDCCKKLLMNATALDFCDESFDNVTFFYNVYEHGNKSKGCFGSISRAEERRQTCNLGLLCKIGLSNGFFRCT